MIGTKPIVDPSINPGKTWWLPSAFGLTIILLGLATMLSIHIKADDIWWHLSTGQYILDNLTLPDSNMYSHTAPNHHWLPHEWASEVVFYLVYQVMGFKGLVALGILLNILACALVFRLTLRYSNAPYLSIAITMLAALMMLGNFSLRPYLFGNLFFIIALHALEEPAAGGKLRPVLVFLLFSAWANFHGSFILGLALIMLYMSAQVAIQLRAKRRSFAGLRALGLDLLVAIVASTVTPHHIYGLIFPFTYLQAAFTGQMTYLTNISEWQSAGFDTPLGRMITFYTLFCFFAIAGSATSPAPVHVGLLVAFTFFSFTTIRNIPLLGIAATPVLARHLPKTLARVGSLLGAISPLAKPARRLHESLVIQDRRSMGILLPGLLTLFALLAFNLPSTWPMSYARLTGKHKLADLSPSFYPTGLIQHLKDRGTSNHIFQYFNWGGAFIYGLYPTQRVFIDQRNDCYPISVFLDYFAVHELRRDWRGVLDRWAIDMVAYPRNEALSKLLREEPGWTLEYEDDQAVLFVRKKEP